MKHKVDLKTKLLMDFFQSKGAKFVDAETGEEIEPELKDGFDRDKFANDFEEEHGWCPDAGYDEIKRSDE